MRKGIKRVNTKLLNKAFDAAMKQKQKPTIWQRIRRLIGL